MHAQPRRTIARGFTVMELVVSITVSVIICGAASALLWNAASQQAQVAARADMIDNGSAAMELMVRYLREITQNECPGNPTPCLNGNAQVTTATSTLIQWGSYGFRQNGTTLEMSTDNAASWHRLTTDLSTLQLTYFNRTGQDLSTQSSPGNLPANMRRIVIDLTLSRATQVVHLRTGLFLRNFMNEVNSDPV
ncbi:MAG TPA: hypothetical protein VMV81_14185 [Phycisphaerae bacterium]|nr:hypothetical protein [Phycisphaerae bacterium]